MIKWLERIYVFLIWAFCISALITFLILWGTTVFVILRYVWTVLL